MALIYTTDLTSGTLDGTGVFDQLMRAVKAHLQEEFAANRIKSGDYATVYVGAITAVMQQASQFILSQQQADKQAELIAAQTAITTQQTANAVTENGLLLKQQAKLDADIVIATNQAALIAQQQANAILEGNILVTQELKLDSDIALQGAQLAKTNAETAMIQQETANALTNNATLLLQQTKLQEEALLVTKQTALLAQQILNAAAEKDKITADIGLTNAQVTLTNTNNSVQLKQIDKATAEITVLNQRNISEQAQTSGTVTLDGAGNPVPSIGGVLGRQMALYYAQTAGFKRDAEYKLAKAAMDIWSVKRTTDETLAADPAGLGDASLAAIIAKAKAGIGI